MKTTLEEALALDATDKLASYRTLFHFPKKDGKECIYLCGNSLGLQPKSTAEYVGSELSKWKEYGVEGHFSSDKPWVKYHENAKGALSKIVGAKESEVVAMNNLTTNLHLALASFYRPTADRKKVIIERGAFPSDFYAVHSFMEIKGIDPGANLIQLQPQEGEDCLETMDIINAIREHGKELALVLLPGIQYYTGQFLEIEKITKAAHAEGAFIGFDLAHAIGNVPLSLHDHEVDFAVWCTYKYLNSGPGSVGGLFIHEKHAQNKATPRLSGWWGHNSEARFKMNNEINPIASVDGWQLSNLNIISQAAHLASLEIFEKAGMEHLRKKSVTLTHFLERLINDSTILKKQIRILTPSDQNQRGAQLSLYLVNHGKSVFDFLIENHVILDWREPNVIRVAPTPLYNSFEDVARFTDLLEKAIANEG